MLNEFFSIIGMIVTGVVLLGFVMLFVCGIVTSCQDAEKERLKVKLEEKERELEALKKAVPNVPDVPHVPGECDNV